MAHIVHEWKDSSLLLAEVKLLGFNSPSYGYSLYSLYLKCFQHTSDHLLLSMLQY